MAKVTKTNAKSKTNKAKKKAKAKIKKEVENSKKGGSVGTETFVKLEGSDNDYLYRWKWATQNTDHFEVDVEYQLKNSNVWVQFDYQNVPTTSQADGWFTCVFTLPNNRNIKNVRAAVLPVAQTHEVKSNYKEAIYHKATKKKKAYYTYKTHYYTQELPYWTATWGSPDTIAVVWNEDGSSYIDGELERPGKPGTPSASLMEDGQVSLTWSKASNAKEVHIRRYENGSEQYVDAVVTSGSTTTTFDLSAQRGNWYRYTAIARNDDADFEWSEESELSSVVYMPPCEPTELVASAGNSASSMVIEWADSGYTGDSYEIGYSTNPYGWDGDDYQTKTYESTPTDGANRYLVTGLDGAKTWYVRVRRHSSGGWSYWSDMASTVIGTIPEAPTIVSPETSYVRGDVVAVSWVHNSEDKSEQSAYELEISVTTPDGNTTTEVVAGGTEKSYALDTSAYLDGTVVAYRVRTKGLVEEWGAWSEQTLFTVYVRPAVTVIARHVDADGDIVSTDAPLPSLPLALVVKVGEGTSAQSAIEWNVSILAKESYTYIGDDGENAYMPAGEEIYSYFINSNEADFSPDGFVLQVGAADAAFVPAVTYEVTAVAVMDSGLRSDEGFCEFSCMWDGEMPQPSASVSVEGDMTARIFPACYEEDGTLAKDVTLSVYRIDGDDSLVPIATGIPNAEGVQVTDPHPNFGTCWYRVIANQTSTDTMSVYDEELEVPFDDIVVQWDETVASESVEGEDPMSCQTLILPKNIQITERHDKDVVYKRFAGREQFVSRYGTHRGEGGSWHASIRKTSDAHLLKLARRLANHMGDCYVREPSGAGYLAGVVVTITHSAERMGMDIDLEVTRVEDDA